MKPVYAFGELLIDFLQFNATTEDGLRIPHLKQYPGGAPANAAVAAAKLGNNVFFLGQVGKDSFGDFLIAAIKRYGIDTRYLKQAPKANTPLAFVTLDELGERSFEFLRRGTADLIIKPEDLPDVASLEKGVWHLCSNTLTETGIRNTHYALVDSIQKAGHWLSFDVNLRKNLWAEGQDFVSPVIKLLPKAQIIKVSREELLEIYPENPEEQLSALCFSGVTQAIFITDGGNPVRLITRDIQEVIPAPEVQVVDTTAGGDGFSGGLLSYVAKENEAEINWVNACKFALKCGAIAVSQQGAFTSLPTEKDLRALI